jgi:hypothetical protein
VGLWLLLMVGTRAVPLAVFAVCARIVWRRRGTGIPLVVPIVVAAVALVAALWISRAFILTPWADDPATKAIALSMGISEGLNWTAFYVLVGGPGLLMAFLLDRWLRQGHRGTGED